MKNDGDLFAGSSCCFKGNLRANFADGTLVT